MRGKSIALVFIEDLATEAVVTIVEADTGLEDIVQTITSEILRSIQGFSPPTTRLILEA